MTIKNLRPCKACGNDVSKSAAACPHCGQNLRGFSFFTKLLIGIFALFVFFIVAPVLVEDITKASKSSALSPNAVGSASTNVPQGGPQQRKVGETAKTNELEVTVTSVQTTEKIGNGPFGQAASEGAVFVTVEWKYKNISKKPLGLFHKPSLKLVDSQGVEYDSDLGASMALATELDLTEKAVSDLNPGITVTGAEAFEVAKDQFDSSKWHLLVDADQNVSVALRTDLRQSVTAKPAISSDALSALRSAISESTPVQSKAPNLAPSYDCANASTSVEKLICANEGLAALDLNLAQAYQQKLNDIVDQAAFRKLQNDWRLGVRDSCEDTSCLIQAYRRRIEQLQQ